MASMAELTTCMGSPKWGRMIACPTGSLKYRLADHFGGLRDAEFFEHRRRHVPELGSGGLNLAVAQDHARDLAGRHAMIGDPRLRVVFHGQLGHRAQGGLPRSAIASPEAHENIGRVFQVATLE